MNIHEDFEEFLKLLNKRNVDFIIVGGYAVAFHGYVRTTKDLDILFRNTPQNIRNLRSALNHFGFPDDSLEDVAFSEQGKIIRMGVSPVMIELINAISGVSFEKAWENRIRGSYGKVTAFYLSKPDLLKNKKASGRPQDIADIEELKNVKK
ncbi:MAG TPA: DUF6036 family nucleotidyltransferase [Chitinivibrionales bacterium]|jgi:hypothetical protein|nr:DUF6036 family nucleotidyltransferase [Chitinivibrionales bacterium]